jgi:hypothetical protein
MNTPGDNSYGRQENQQIDLLDTTAKLGYKVSAVSAAKYSLQI